MRTGRESRFRSLWQATWLLAAAQAVGAAEPALPPMQWRAVPAEELTMTAEPGAPGAAAVYLYTELNQRPAKGTEQFYRQIKVLTEQGRDYANITIQYRKLLDTLSDIEARVIQPDGSVIPFTGRVYDRELVSGEGWLGQLMALSSKTLALPDVRVGSIIEYRYTVTHVGATASQFNWMLNQEHFTRLARFSNRPIGNMQLRMYVPQGWPKGTTPARLEDDGTIRMEARNLPAFEAEEFAPPAASLMQRVEFVYSGSTKNPTDFWPTLLKDYHEGYESRMKIGSSLRNTVKGLVKAGDSDEQKARRIYDHVQQLKNTAYEGPLSTKEQARRDSLQPMEQYWEVGKRGFGNSGELALYCVALLRTAGLAAQPVLVGGRAQRFFDREARRPEDLTAVIVSLQLGAREVLLDPTIPLLPFGALVWSDTAVSAVKLDANGGQWIEIPAPQSAETTIRREARLKLSADGVLEGTVTVTHTGHQALGLRMTLLNADTAARTQALEAQLKSSLPESAVVKLLEQPDWQGVGTPLQVKYQLTVPDWVVSSGARLLVGVGLFGGGEKRLFLAEKRQHPIYFEFPFEMHDEVRIELPEGYRLENLPPPAPPSTEPLLRYRTTVAGDGGALLLRREVTVGVLMTAAANYSRFRDFFQIVRSGDEQQILLAR